jgi:long-chain acyl-CoA synthetase
MEEHYITPEQAVTLHGLFLERARRTPNDDAYTYFDDELDTWVTLSWGETHDQVARWQSALRGENLEQGDRVAVMMCNCPQWVMYEQAALSLGLVLVPLFADDRPDNIAYIVNHAQIKLFFFENEEQWQKLHSVIGQLDSVQRFISLKEISVNKVPQLVSALSWLPDQAQMISEATQDKDALALILYTSGTTGKPKGVMLSHYNIFYNAYAGLKTFTVLPSDRMLSFLPLSHALEHTAGYYMAMIPGASVAYARSIPQLADDLLTIRPTMIVSVPRIFERIYNAIYAKLQTASPLRRKLFENAVDIGWARFQHQQGRGPWRAKILLWPIFKLLVANKLLGRLGGRIRLAVSGGAALSPKVSRVFIALGLPLTQGYGMTETSPVVSINRVDNNLPATVGQPLPGIEVRTGEHSALLVRGPSNMLGYWNNPDATSAIIDQDGWLNTGDTATISQSGHITITGRLKEIIVMSNGEKVPPADMENAILHDTLFEQVMLYGDGHSYLVALIVLNPEQWQIFAQQLGVTDVSQASLNDALVQEAVLRRISDQVKEFPGYANVRRVFLSLEPWSVENGLLTTTLKLKRAKVVSRFKGEIEHLYEGH